MKYNDQAVLNTIHDRTKELLLTRGVKGWNMDQLAAASGLAKNTLYKIIGSKENACVSVIIRDINNISSEIYSVMDDDRNNLDIHSIAEIFTKMMATIHGDYFKQILMEYPGSQSTILANKQIADKALVRFFELNMERKLLREDCDQSVLHDMVEGMVSYYLQKGYHGDELTDRLAVTFEYMMNGILRK